MSIDKLGEAEFKGLAPLLRLLKPNNPRLEGEGFFQCPLEGT
jgi:hypothetical protein